MSCHQLGERVRVKLAMGRIVTGRFIAHREDLDDWVVVNLFGRDRPIREEWIVPYRETEVRSSRLD